MSEEYTQHLKISSKDGKNTVEQFINFVNKRADKGRVEFGADIQVERVEPPAEIEGGFDE